MTWTAPFAKWVVEGWKKHSEAVNGPKIAARIRKDLVEKAKEKSVEPKNER
jgi:hypothetical protein